MDDEVSLRNYQDHLVGLTRVEMRTHRNVLNVLPTGGGKTFCGSFMLRNFREKMPEGNAVVQVHREELLIQWYNSMRAIGLEPGLCVAGKPNFNSRITIAMIETFNKQLQKRPSLADHFKFAIADEAHIGNHFKVMDAMRCRYLGLTATPLSSNRSRPLKELYGSIVCPYSEADLTRLGYLLPAKTYSQDYDFSKLKKTGRDFSDASQLEEFTKPKLYDGALKEYLRHCGGSKKPGQNYHRALCFNVNVAHSIEMLGLFRSAGIKCEHVDGDTPKDERKAHFAALARGDIDVLHNVGVATIGLDETSLEAIILNRATSSLSLYIQMCGRGARPHSFSPFCKLDHFKIIDMGMNYTRHGLFGAPIDWRNIYENQNNDSKAKPQTKPKECPECGARIVAGLEACPWCDHEFSKAEIAKAEEDGMTSKEIKEYKFQQLPPNLRKKTSEMSYPELVAFGKAMGYSDTWANMQQGFRKKARKRRFDRP